MTNKFTLTQKLRTGHVKRWQIVRVAREQTIAEHMYRVNKIAMHIADQMPTLEDADLELINDWSLFHDMPEVVTGDIATPTKMAMRKAVPDSDPIKHIELELDTDYHYLYQLCKTQHPVVLVIVKLADIFEAVDFLNTEALGHHAKSVMLGLQEAFFSLLKEAYAEYPEHNWNAYVEGYMEVIFAKKG